MKKPVVYFVQNQETLAIKIGTTKDLAKRLSMLQVGCCQKLKLVHSFEGGKTEERIAHEKFRASKIRGEWFNPTDDLIQFIDNNNTVSMKDCKLYQDAYNDGIECGREYIKNKINWDYALDCNYWCNYEDFETTPTKKQICDADFQREAFMDGWGDSGAENYRDFY